MVSEDDSPFGGGISSGEEGEVAGLGGGDRPEPGEVAGFGAAAGQGDPGQPQLEESAAGGRQ
ncbi:MAG TPA: hypothetical protein VMR14_19900, partial [Streptosporangiaceae bacterium]|nr:hypothetical protein [Streptosporangiaceae bacterium]